MAVQLWFLRHGDAVPHGSRESDSARELTERGIAQARAAGAALRSLELVPGAVLASPRVRARQTAELACEALGLEPVVHAALSGGFDADAARALATAGGADGVLFVGHEPDFSQIVHDLTGARIDMKKGGLAGVRLDGGHGELIVLLRPRELRAIA